jgi:peroxiredoxin
MKKIFFMVTLLIFMVLKNVYAHDIDMKLRYPYSNDNSTNLSKFIGKKPLFIAFFYPKCRPCEKSVKAINKIYDKYKHYAVIIGISLSKDRYDLEDFVTDFKVKYPVYRIDSKAQLNCIGGIFATPTMIIIDRNGIVVEKIIGPRDFKFFEEKLKKYVIRKES